ncbi:hypothetical protein [Agrococcus sp. SGAir0287]|uniref:hypothetical protein n=1 Tax=Agrococcus sp. SGAir0287 TaxID=2070347 RepID=UPI0010CD2364|nr:hypothetical protein [Agrococcus sp. SGAir0287]QCR19633.1 hypothetical protein C1N71_09550 [Agrococcus sp. SGAir0287]
MAAPRPLDLSPLARRPTRAHATEHRRLLRQAARRTRTPMRLVALVVVGAIALAVTAVPVVAVALALTTDDAERRTSATTVAVVVGVVLLAIVVVAAARLRAPAGPALVALAEANDLTLEPVRLRDVADSGTWVAPVRQHDDDVLRDADGVRWGRTTIVAGDGSALRSRTTVAVAFVAVPLGGDVPHMLLADRRAGAAPSIAPDAIGALELVPATLQPWRVWTTEPDAASAATIVDAELLAALERWAPGLDVELVDGTAFLTRVVDVRWRPDGAAWHALVDGIRIGLAPVLRAAAARARRREGWAPQAHDPLARSLVVRLAARARTAAWRDAVVEVVGTAGS